MQRISAKLTARGIRTFRLDLRGCGAGVGLSRLPYHAGQSDDIQVTAEFIRHLVPGSSLMTVGFSLGGNILLKWLGEQAETMPSLVSRAMAVNPPLNLEACTDHVRVVARGVYDRHFARLLCLQAQGTPHWHDDTPLSRSPRQPRRIIDFDELFTAPLAGYDNAREYYRACSAEPVIPQINVPTLILSAKDDPLIPSHTLERLNRPPCVKLHIAEGGGHLGYIGRSGHDPDRHWMDWRVIDWLTQDQQQESAA
jgi:predicted alpha/beta-fold hydrolase